MTQNVKPKYPISTSSAAHYVLNVASFRWLSLFYMTLSIIALLSLTSCGTPSNTPAPVVNMGQKNSSAGVAIVQEYDTIWHIAKRFNLPMRDIISLNKIRPPFVIHENQRLRLPPPREYKVRSGDTLYEISRMFETDMNSVARLNKMRSPYVLQVNQTLRMPSPNRTVQSTQTRTASSVNRNTTTKNAATTPRSKPKNTTSALNVPKRSGSGRFAMPVEGRVLSGYGPKEGGLHNDGINILASRGTTVNASENGVVAYTGDDIGGYGNLVLIRHADNYMTAYAHLSSMSVKRGDQIKRGQKIGAVGATGNVDRPQLHFEIRKGSKALNPEPLI